MGRGGRLQIAAPGLATGFSFLLKVARFLTTLMGSTPSGLVKAREPFMFADLWDSWSDPQQEFQTFTIITAAANPMVAKIHNRMPVILHQGDYEKWLRGPDETLLKPFPETEMACYRVNKFVNSSRNEGENCIEPV